CHACTCFVGVGHLYHCVFWAAIVVHAGDGAADRLVSATSCRLGGGTRGIWRSDGWNRFWTGGGIFARSWLWLRHSVCDGRFAAYHRVSDHSFQRAQGAACRFATKIELNEGAE